MKITYLDNGGQGFAEIVEVAEGTTVGQLFMDKKPNEAPSSYLIRVNRQPCTHQQVLTDGCTVSVVPSKVDGAAQTR